MNMKKKLLVTAIAGSLLSAGVANAEDMSFYVGGDVNYNKPSFKKDSNDATGSGATMDGDKVVVDKKKPGLNLFLGTQFTENFAAEVGYGFIQKAKGTAGANGDVTNKVSNMYIDAIGLLPVCPEVDLQGSLGMGWMKAKVNVANVNVDSKLNKRKAGIRAGVGARYKFDANWSTRFTVNYQKANKEFLKNNTSAGLGLAYTF
jgi:opacity protein-like surface antigen